MDDRRARPGTAGGAAWALAFVLLFAVYQSAEGVGGRWLGSFAVQAGLMTAALLLAWPLGRFLLRRGGYRAYGLGTAPPAGRALAAGLALALACKAGALLLGAQLGIYRVQAAPAAAPLQLAGVLAFGLLATFIASTAEDILTRGVLWGALEGRRRGAGFVVASAVVYTLNHVYRLGAGPSEWAMLLAFGLAYGAGAAATGTLWGAVGLHWGWNLANLLVDTLLSVEADRSRSWALSAGAHLVMLAACAAWALSRPRRGGRS